MNYGMAVVGLGRIGGLLCREGLTNNDPLPIRAMVDIANPSMIAALMNFDSNYGYSKKKIIYDDQSFQFGANVTVPFYHPDQLSDYRKLGIRLVIDATGRASTRQSAFSHIEKGADQVLVTMPPKSHDDTDLVLLYQVNHENFDPQVHRLLSNASCTTNCLVHLVLAFSQAGQLIRAGFFTTVHAYTNTQKLVDGAASALGDSWSAPNNIIVSETGAAKSIGMIFPEFKEKIIGLAARVPVSDVSLLEAHFKLESKITRAELVNIYRGYVDAGHQETVAMVKEEYWPSRAFLGDKHSCIIVEPALATLDDNLVRVMAWYDNEMAYAQRLIDLCRYIKQRSMG